MNISNTLKKMPKRLAAFAGLIVFSAAVWVLYHELKSYHLKDIIRLMLETPFPVLLISVSLTAINYVLMTAYDYMAFRYIDRKFPFIKIAPVSFTSFAFSNNMGFGMIAGSSVRFREYSAWGLSALDITKVILFCGLTVWTGFFFIGGLAFVLEPAGIPQSLHIPFSSFSGAGFILLIVLTAYVLLVIFRKKPVYLFRWSIDLPGTKYLLPQLLVSSLDWLLAGSVLYMVLSVPDLSFVKFITYYLIAVFAGLISQAPGGLGVFEMLIVVFLSPFMPAGKIMGSLILYRVIYYLMPLVIAACMTAVREVWRSGKKYKPALENLAKHGLSIVPSIMAVTSFCGGVVLLLSGVTPGLDWRLNILVRFIPLPVFELSHFLGSIAGIGLIILARGIQHRLNSAYILTIAFLLAGICFSLLKGLDWEEAFILTGMLLLFILSKHHFYRHTSLFNQRFNPGWIAAILLVIITSVWLGFFSYKHVEYSNELWWNFEIYGNASRFMRASVGISVFLIIFGSSILLKRKRPGHALQELSDERLRGIVGESVNTNANLALLGDKDMLFSDKYNAFIMYGVKNRTWVAMGDPVGSEEEWPELIWRFRELSDAHDGTAAFYEVRSDNLHLYLDIGLTPLKLGEQARIRLETFSIQGNRHKGLKHNQNKIDREGYNFEIIPRDKSREILPVLRRISDSWLQSKNTREKGFSLGYFSEEYVSLFPIGIVRKDRDIVAFVTIWCGARKEELSIDLMRFSEDSPAGVMDYLFVKLMLRGKEEGYRWFDLGMAPLSGLESHALLPVWNRLGYFIFRHGEHFYNFQGLRQYKEKFDPIWEPRYLATETGLRLPVILANIAGLIAGGIKGIIAK